MISFSKSSSLLIILILALSSIIVAEPAYSATNNSANNTENTWTEKTPMHQARAGMGVAVVDGKIYAIGGFNSTGEVGANEEYNPLTNTWVYKAPMPTPRYYFATAVLGDKIYCIGGDLNNGITGVNQVYNPINDTWENKAPMPTQRELSSAHVLNGKIYVIGGNQNYTLNEMYDPATDTWSEKAPLLNLPSFYDSIFLTSWTYNNTIYAVAGYEKSAFSTQVYVIEIYNPLTDTWVLAAQSPNLVYKDEYGVGVTTGVMAPLRVYVFSGDSHGNQIYDPQTGSWSFGAAIPTERYIFGVAVVDDLIYVIGGCINTGFPELVETMQGSTPVFHIILNETDYATVEMYTPFGYGTAPPAITVASPKNLNYSSSAVDLNFTTNRPVNWIGYSLDGQNNVTVTDNITLSGLAVGLHKITVYANDSLGNVGASQTVNFTITQEPFPTVSVVVVSAVLIAAVISILLYRSRKHG